MKGGRSGLAVVILHYGRPETTRRLHGQLLESDPDFADRLFVLDNHAPEPYPDAWLRARENLYWAGAFDLAARLMGEAGFSHLWFLNNDLYFLSRPPHLARTWERLGRMEKAFGRVGIVSPAVDKNPYHPQMTAAKGLECRLAAVLDGVAPLVSLACLREVGGLDFADNPMGYGVDVMLSLRAREAGWLLAVDQQTVIRHVFHTAARAEPGFLDRAAAAERAYLEKRLGPGYRAFLEAAKRDFTDHRALPRKGLETLA